MKNRDKMNQIEQYRSNVSVKAPNRKTDEASPEINLYYQSVSQRFRIAKILCVGFLCLFILTSLFVFGESFTYENARYLLRDIGQIISDDSSTPSAVINVQADGDMNFDIYKGNIVVAGESCVKIISPSGKEKLSDSTTFTRPSIVSSDKYCIVYSLGAYNLSVYNTVARVYDMTFEFPIYSVAQSDNGYIAVMTHSREYRCTVYLYNSDFKLCATYNKNKYPSAVDISSDGKHIYISTFTATDGEYSAELSSYIQNTTEPIFSHVSYGDLPVDLYAISNDRAAILYTGKILIIGNDGEVIKEINLSSSIYKANFNDDYITVIEGDAQKTVRVYTKDGEEISTNSYSDISRAYTFDGCTFIQKKSHIEWKTGENNRIFELKNNTAKLLYFNGYIYVCYSDGIYTQKTR